MAISKKHFKEAKQNVANFKRAVNFIADSVDDFEHLSNIFRKTASDNQLWNISEFFLYPRYAKEGIDEDVDNLQVFIEVYEDALNELIEVNEYL